MSNNLGYRPIYQWDEPNMKQLNDTLRAMWDKVMGNLEMKDLSRVARKIIDSKASGEVVDELTGVVRQQSTLIEQTREEIRLKADQSEIDGAVGSVVVEYYLSDSASEPSGGEWSKEAPTWVEGKYIWQRTKTTLMDGTEQYGEAVCITVSAGQGVGIEKVIEHYAVSDSGTEAPSDWQDTPPEMSAENRFLWNYETIRYTNGREDDTDARVIGAYGADGRGIAGIKNYYLATSYDFGVDTETLGWTEEVQKVTATKKYLWNYEEVTYTDGSRTNTKPCIIGMYGEGVGIEEVLEHYAVSASNTEAPSKWEDTPPEMSEENRYLWNYETIRYTNGNSVDTPACVIGVYGADGRGIESVTDYYLAAAESSGVTTKTVGWTEEVQTVTNEKRYLWNYEKVTYTDGSETSTEPCVIGVYGDAGVGIEEVQEHYAVSDSGTEAPSEWEDTPPEMSEEKRYLWNYETIRYTDGHTVDTPKCVIGVYGSDGRGIESVTNYYLASAKDSGVTTETAGWTKEVQKVTAEQKYLWNYEEVVYTDGSRTKTEPCIIGMYGEGVGIEEVQEHYAVSASGTRAPEEWEDTPPEMSAENRYLWNYETVRYTNGKSVDTPACVIGVYGSDGRGIESVTNYYLATDADSGVTTKTAGWTEEVQTVTNEKRYLWNYEKVTYTDGSETSTEPCVIGVYGDAGAGIEEVQEHYAVSASGTEAPSEWEDNPPEMTAEKRYLWNYETIRYTDGNSVDTPKCVIGVYGSDGRGIESVTNYYLASVDNHGVTTKTVGWTEAVQTVTNELRYLWNYEKVTYTDGSETETEPCIIGVYGDAGVGIGSIDEHYAVSASDSEPPEEWEDTPPTMTAEKRYLWNYETLHYTDNTATDTQKRVIGVYGESGADGRGIKSVTNYYLATEKDSGVTTGTPGWTETVQSVTVVKKYLWNYEVIDYTDGSPATTTAPCIIGVYGQTGDKGDKGEPGAAGRGIESIVPQYYLSNSETRQTGGEWSDTPPVWEPGKYIWVRSKITWDDGDVTYTTPVLDRTLNDVAQKVTEAQAELVVQAGLIEGKASLSTVNELGERVTVAESQIKQTPEQIKLAVQNIEIGGRNLLPSSEWTRESYYRFVEIYVYEVLKDYVGRDLCVSFDCRVADDGEERELHMYPYQSNGISIADEFHFTPTKEWQRFTFRTRVRDWGDNDPTWTKGSIGFYDDAGTNHYFVRRAKLELGTVPTDWTPSPDDPASGVNAGGVVEVNKEGVYIKGGEIDLRTSDNSQFVHISEEAVTASNIVAPNLVYRYLGPSMIHVNVNATGEQIAAGTHVRSLADAFAMLSGKVLTGDVSIAVESDSTGEAVLAGVMGSGGIGVGGQCTQNGNMRFVNVQGQVYIQDLTVLCTGGACGVEVTCAHVHMASCTVNANKAYWGVYAQHGATIMYEGGQVHNASVLFGVAYGGIISGANVSGQPADNGLAIYANCGIVIWSGTRPSGGLSLEPSVNNLTSSSGGGTSGGSTPPTPSTSGTNSYTMTGSDTYGSGSWSWGQHNDIVQGYTTGAGRLYGCIWFDNTTIRNALKGKTLKGATLRLSMYSGVGRGATVNVELYGTTTNYSGRSSAPSLTKSYGSIGTTDPGQTKAITLPTQVATDLVAGTINGLVLYSSDTSPHASNVYSRNYARFYGETTGDAGTYPVLTITY